ncbi:MAG: hypothetical protein QM723_38285 [Myxococcaceae bacterium]
MKTLSLLALCLLAAPPPDLAAQADTAYRAKDYLRCAEAYEKMAEGDAKQQLTNHWNSASCFSLAKLPDRAFHQLDLALALGRPEPKELGQDDDLANLHADPRWARLLENAQAKIDAYEKTVAQPKLRKELLAMKDVDQEARQAQVKAAFKDENANKKAEAIDVANTKRMKEIVATKGWPGKSLVGEDGASAAWLLVQHADKDLPFQKLCLAKLEEAKNKGEVEPQNWAYLVDRVAVAEKRPQTFGTQFDNELKPRPIEDEAHVDERRKSVGLGTLAQYREQMRQAYAPK